MYPNVNGVRAYLLSEGIFTLSVSLVWKGGEKRCSAFTFGEFASLLWWNKGSALLKGLGHRQDMRVVVALTVNSGDKVL